MADLSKTLASEAPQITAADLLGGPRELRVTSVTVTDAKEQPVTIHYEGENGKPYKPCLSMRRVLVRLWGADGNKYTGRTIRVFNDPDVSYGSERTGGVRIAAMSDIGPENRTIPLTVGRGTSKPYTVEPITAQVHAFPTPGAEAEPVITSSVTAAPAPTDPQRQKDETWAASARAAIDRQADAVALQAFVAGEAYQRGLSVLQSRAADLAADLVAHAAHRSGQLSAPAPAPTDDLPLL